MAAGVRGDTRSGIVLEVHFDERSPWVTPGDDAWPHRSGAMATVGLAPISWTPASCGEGGAEMGFFKSSGKSRGPTVTAELIRAAEERLGVRLPETYLDLVRQQNGGAVARTCFPTKHGTSWAADHFQVSGLMGLGYRSGIDGELGGRYLVQEWGYPEVGVVIFDTPSGGHDAVMLDYSACGSRGEPRVVYIDEARVPILASATLREFIEGLVGETDLPST